jgi:hypothetical protein
MNRLSFDYGDKKANGQYENYPSQTSGEYVAPIRNSYIHGKCGVKTLMATKFAETYAKNPKYYGSTFCCGCGEHLPVSQFTWAVDGIRIGEIGGEPGKDLMESRKIQ